MQDYFELAACGHDFVWLKSQGPFTVVLSKPQFLLKVEAAEGWQSTMGLTEYILSICNTPRTREEINIAVRTSGVSNAEEHNINSSVCTCLTRLCGQGRLKDLGENLFYLPGVNPRFVIQASDAFRDLLREAIDAGIDLRELLELAETGLPFFVNPPKS